MWSFIEVSRKGISEVQVLNSYCSFCCETGPLYKTFVDFCKHRSWCNRCKIHRFVASPSSQSNTLYCTVFVIYCLYYCDCKEYSKYRACFWLVVCQRRWDFYKLSCSSLLNVWWRPWFTVLTRPGAVNTRNYYYKKHHNHLTVNPFLQFIVC